MTMTPETLARRIEDFLIEAADAVVIEDGHVIFDLAHARYSVTAQPNKCLLHLWSEERNAVRRVLDCEQTHGNLRLSVQRFGQPLPTVIEVCRDRDRRSASTKKAHRAAYQRLLSRVLRYQFPAYTLDRLSSAMDLEHSFGPVYARGLIRKGQSAFAVLGVNEEEDSATVDAALSFGVLWLNVCRVREAGHGVVQGLKLFLPSRRSAVVRARAAQLNHALAKFHIFELEERDEILREFDPLDAGNISTRLVHCPDRQAVMQRFAASIDKVRSIVPHCEVVVPNSAGICFRLNGLEFARARLRLTPGSFQQQQEMTFGTGRFETLLDEATAPQFAELMARVCASRHADASGRDALWRLQPERWLESLIARNLDALDVRLDSSCVYSQVPAFAAGDRAMIDVLASTREGQLSVIEIKASEDIHLPFQGLDYWARVKWHHERSEFQQFGYFPGKQLSADPPLLLLVAPALRIHPTLDTLLQYLNPQISWTLAAVDENWRNRLKVVFRKHRLIH
jgi:hypothetical protein